MRVLIISANTLPAAPSGPAYVAGAVRQAGHVVEVYESLFTTDLVVELAAVISRFMPDVVGISIRLVQADILNQEALWGTLHFDLRPSVKKIVDVIQKYSSAVIVLGGPGFNYYALDWLDFLNVDYGIRGEGEESFPYLLQCLQEEKDFDHVPGLVYRKGEQLQSNPQQPVKDLNSAALPAYDLFNLDEYIARKITPSIFTKRGCGFSCTYCPYSELEGKEYRLKSPERVMAEIDSIRQHCSAKRIMFCDNNFNVPKPHAESLCCAFIEKKTDFEWGTGDLKPIGITNDLCHLMKDSGCFYINLAIESASNTMLKKMQRGYSTNQVQQSLEVLSRSEIPFGASLMIGAPGETPDTIAESLSILNEYSIPQGVWVTIGIYLWTQHQRIVRDLQQIGHPLNRDELFAGRVYLSPQLDTAFLKELVADLREKPGYDVQVNGVGNDWIV